MDPTPSPPREDTWNRVTSAMDRTDLFHAFYENLFHDMDSTFVTDFIERTQVQKFDAHAVVVKQGDNGDSFYIVKDGAVDVLVRDDRNHRDVTVTTLKKHQYFGEVALLDVTQSRRHATITTREPTTLIQIKKEDFLELVKRHPRFESVLRNRMKKSLQQNKNIAPKQ